MKIAQAAQQHQQSRLARRNRTYTKQMAVDSTNLILLELLGKEKQSASTTRADSMDSTHKLPGDTTKMNMDNVSSVTIDNSSKCGAVSPLLSK